jgi:transposase
MDQYEFIRTAHRVYGKNISELSRMTGHSRNTVKKALTGEPCGYKEREQQPFPVLGPFLGTIDEWLQDDLSRPKKQRHTARRIYNRLVAEHGYTGGESTVRHYVRDAKARLGFTGTEAYIPGDPEAGYEAEVDWGTASAILGGKLTQLKIFCMRSKYSGKHFVRAYPCERQQAFFDAHLHAFQFFLGIFAVLIYDNLTAAVRKILQGRDRIEQETFGRFRAYHSFEARFTNANAGHEKGGVEGLVGFVRRNYLVPVPEAADLDELNEKLLLQCQSYGSHVIAGRTQPVETLYEQEKSHLLDLPKEAYTNELVRVGRVDKYSTVIIDKNRYSVPTSYAGRQVSVSLGVDKVSIHLKSRQLATHKRLYGNNKWQLDPDHYLDLLQKRPQAYHSARPIRQWRPSWPKELEKLQVRFCEVQGETKGIKDFITVLMFYRSFATEEVEAAVKLAMEKGISSSEGVRHLLHAANDVSQPTTTLAGWESLPATDVSQYGQLGDMQ